MSGQKEVSKSSKKSNSSDQLLTTLKSAVDCPKLTREILQSRESLRVFVDKWNHFRVRYKQPSLFSLVTVEVDAFLSAVSEPYLVALKALENDANSSEIPDDLLLRILKKIYPPDMADVTLQKLRALSLDLSLQSSKPDSIIGAFGKYVSDFQLILREGDSSKPPQFRSVKKIFLENLSPKSIRAAITDRTEDIYPREDELLSESFVRLAVVFRKYCYDLRNDRARTSLTVTEGGAGSQLAEENANLKRKLAQYKASSAVNMNVDDQPKKKKRSEKRKERATNAKSKKTKTLQCFGCGESGHARPACPNKDRSDYVDDKDSRHPRCK
mgnify:CR=1 FL=1